MNRDELEGKVDKAKGWVKDKAGEVSDNPELEAEGEKDRVEGGIKEKLGEARRKAGDAVEDIGDTIKGS